MDSKIMELRLKQWIPIFEEQTKSGLNKQEWCELNDISRAAFFKWQRQFRKYLLEMNENKLQAQLSTELAVHTESEFVELVPTSSSVRSILNDCCVRSADITPTSPISIRYGQFSIIVNNYVNGMLHSKVLKAMADVY